jgi:uncharacterized protein
MHLAAVRKGELMTKPCRSEVLDVLGRHKAEFAERYGITALGVFGSVARDEAGQQSDVDVVFQTDSPNLFRTVHLKRALEAILQRRVDVVRWRERINPRLKARIAREAVYV